MHLVCCAFCLDRYRREQRSLYYADDKRFQIVLPFESKTLIGIDLNRAKRRVADGQSVTAAISGSPSKARIGKVMTSDG